MAKKLSWAWLTLSVLIAAGWLGVGMYQSHELRVAVGAVLGVMAFFLVTTIAIGYASE